MSNPKRDPVGGRGDGLSTDASGGVVDRLTSDRPWAEPRFWILQIVVLALYLARLAAELAIVHAMVPSVPDFTTTAVFLSPVLYAAITFGPTGGLATAAWLLALSMFRVLAYTSHGEPVGAWAEDTQIVVLCIIAVVVGRMVAAERAARLQAESSHRAHLAAEARYRSLFESNAAPILLVSETGSIVEGNPAASRLFGTRLPEEASPTGDLGNLVGEHEARHLLDTALPGGQPFILAVSTASGALRFRAQASSLEAIDLEPMVQVVLNDVTPEFLRQERVEGYAASVVRAQEEERRHIAQELHDGPLQDLVHLCRRIDAVRSGETGADPAELRTLAERIAGELRSISRGLRPSVLDDLGLIAAVRRTTGELERRTGTSVSFGTSGQERRLPDAVELAIFRIAQEALSNVERHASASLVAVELQFEEHGVRLVVSDDGVGFDGRGEPPSSGAAQRSGSPAAGMVDPAGQGGLGVAGMAERARLMGGWFRLDSSPGAGTTVQAWVPGGRR